MVTRRFVLASLISVAGATAALPLAHLTAHLTAKPAGAATLEKADDMAIGASDAPITVIEYFSLTCSHCANFHNDTFPHIKSNYIDTGKVRFIARDFPLNRPALEAAILAHCAGPERYFTFLDALFHGFENWTTAPDYRKALTQIGQLGGVSAAAFEACLKDKALETRVLTSMLEAQQNFDVSSTPTFIVNGKKIEGGMKFGAFAKVLDRLLPGI
jgi:protein-disulfide isomerase